MLNTRYCLLACGLFFLLNVNIAEAMAVETDYRWVDVLKGYCAVAYSPVIELEKPEREGDIRLFFRSIERNEASFAGFLKQVGKTLVVAFPGTRAGQSVDSTISDVKADLKIAGDDGGFVKSLGASGVSVHPGFGREVESFYTEMIGNINNFSGVEEVYFTGHSKGGAISTLCALKYASLERARPNFVKVITFATPAVLNDKGIELAHRTIGAYNMISLYNNTDFVPYSSMFVGFSHAGVPANISYKMKKVADLRAELGSVIANFSVKGVTYSSVFGQLLGIAVNSHVLDSFSSEAIREVICRINGRHSENPFMDRNELGRDYRPLLSWLAFWK